jgi:hypothetical protein
MPVEAFTNTPVEARLFFHFIKCPLRRDAR